MAAKMTPAEVTKALNSLRGWQKVDGRDAITKTYRFKDFKHAFAFMT
ncbi:MAG: 4a-hydroxytetrahydrobiopterin dehydratase, partial [Rhodospirillales bacterium]|nr:4a-hydroxytetrahydrobiopterin dehydratase [Rhodospirillales bacterium]